MVTIVVDNLRADAFDFRGSWATYKADQWLNATVSSSTAANSSVVMTFNGTSAALIGITPPSSQRQTFSVSIDNGTAANTSFADPNPSSYRQWYQSPTLSDGLHTITLSNLANASIDFALVAVGPQTPIGEERIVVDDTASGLSFSPGWRTDRDKFNIGGSVPISGFTLSNSTHDTETVGSYFSYRFSGRAIAVYGLFDFSSPGLLILSFSIDSQSLSQTYRVTSSSPQLVAEIGQQPNYMFYSYDFLTTGEHTLLVNVTTCVNQTFRFDYLTYVPSFARASDMPTYAGGGSSGGTTSPGTGDNNGNRTVKTTVGAALGAVVGSVLLAVLLFFFLRRRTRRKKETEGSSLFGETTSASNFSPTTSPNDHLHSPLLTTTTTPQLSPHSQLNYPLGPMALLQNSSAVQYGLNFPHVHDNGRPVSSPAAGQTVSVNVDPPSYDEVTSGTRT